MSRKKSRISVQRNDSIPAIGAYLRPDGPPDDEPIIYINCDFAFGDFVNEYGKDVATTNKDRRRILVDTLMHEFGHVMEHFLGLGDNESEIERAVCEFRAEEDANRMDGVVKIGAALMADKEKVTK